MLEKITEKEKRFHYEMVDDYKQAISFYISSQ